MREMLDRLVAHADSAAGRVAILADDVQISYGELVETIRGLASWAETLPDTVALLAPRDSRWIIWYLALIWAGRRIVPLPEFFSPSQLSHILKDAAAAVVVCPDDLTHLVSGLDVSVAVPQQARHPSPQPRDDASLVIYTSGTSGRPKGVVLSSRQLSSSVTAMGQAVAATADDRMLSVLPYALLLEQIAGILVPLSVGAEIVLCAQMNLLPMAAETFAPTATVLVPELLTAWVNWLEHTGRTAPPSLRFVAVGGAPVPKVLAEKAWSLGLPVHEGYGLSECCSVVAVNGPGSRRAGTVGRPLPGVTVSIENGEIIVEGPTVMTGYLGAALSLGRHRTGDAGHLDDDGYLIVDGRIDDVIVTTTGRNIHPEWIESMLILDPRIARCAVIGGGTHPHAVLVPASEWLTQATPTERIELVAELCASAPAYARPKGATVLPDALLRQHALITSNGRLRRRAIATYLAETL